MSPTGSSPLIAQRPATKSLTAITGTMVKNGHSRTRCLSAVAAESRPSPSLSYPTLVSVSTDGAPAVCLVSRNSTGNFRHGNELQIEQSGLLGSYRLSFWRLFVSKMGTSRDIADRYRDTPKGECVARR